MTDGPGHSVKRDDPLAMADLQDPLPESNFFYRRIFSYALVVGLLAFAWWFTGIIGDVAIRHNSEPAVRGLVGIVRLALYLMGGAVTFYMIAPSAEQLARIIQTASALKHNVAFRSHARVGDAESTVVAGPAVPASPQAARQPPPAPAGATPVIE